MEQKIRYYSFVDSAKGWGIMLIIAGHLLGLTTFTGLNKLIYSFHVPMFFALSGMLLKPSGKTFAEYLKDKALRLLLPAYVSMLILPLIRALFWESSNFSLVFDREWLIKFFFWDGAPKWNQPAWFFITMFFVCIVQFLLNIENLSADKRVAAASFSFILGYLFVVYKINYFGAANFCICFGSFVLGSIVMQLIRTLSRTQLKILLAVAAILWLIFAGLNPKVSLFFNIYGSYWILIGSAICGSLTWILFWYFMPPCSISKFLSFNTVFIILFHYVAIWGFKSACETWHLANTECANAWCLISLLLILAVNYPLCIFVNGYLPLLNGRRHFC